MARQNWIAALCSAARILPLAALLGLALMVSLALYAPLLASDRPLYLEAVRRVRNHLEAKGAEPREYSEEIHLPRPGTTLPSLA